MKTAAIFMCGILGLSISVRSVFAEYTARVKEFYGGIEFVDGNDANVSRANGIRMIFEEKIEIDRVEIIADPDRQSFAGLGAGYNIYRGQPDMGVAEPGLYAISYAPPLVTDSFYLDFADFAKDIHEVRFFYKESPISLIFPDFVIVDATASSTLEPASVYAVDNVFDNDLETVWCEGARGYGAGETIEMVLDKTIRVSEITVHNGHQRSMPMFRKNGAVREFQIYTRDSARNTYSFSNVIGPQTVRLKEPLSGDTFFFKIISSYPGERFKDVCISELSLGDGATRYKMHIREEYDLARRNIFILDRIQGSQYWHMAYEPRIPLGDTYVYFSYDRMTAKTKIAFNAASSKGEGIELIGQATVQETSERQVDLQFTGYLDRVNYLEMVNCCSFSVRKGRGVYSGKIKLVRPSLMGMDEIRALLGKYHYSDASILDDYQPDVRGYEDVDLGNPDEKTRKFLRWSTAVWMLSDFGLYRTGLYLDTLQIEP